MEIGVFISSCFLFLVISVLLFFRFIAMHLLRNKNSNASSHGDDLSFMESRELKKVKKFDQKGEALMDEKRMSAFSFKYQSQNFEEKMEKIEEKEQKDEIGTEVISEKEFSGFVDEPAETMTFLVNESFTDFEEDNFYEADADMRFLSIEDFLKPTTEFIFEEESNSDESFFWERGDDDDDDVDDLSDQEVFGEDIIAEKLSPLLEEDIFPDNFFAKNDLTGKSELIGSEGFSMEIERSSDSASPIANSLKIEFIEDSEQRSELFDTEDVDNIEDDKSNYDLIISAKVSVDTEHQDFIKQLKREIKKARVVSLPTILEETDSPRTVENLGSFRFDEKFLREDPMDELQEFYKSYRERMRKFDLLNYEKMYLLGFLQTKNPLRSMGTQRKLLSTIMSHLRQSLLHFCKKNSKNDAIEKLFKDLQCDLETIYVGQTCLSWEFLRWQYEKYHEPLEFDLCRSYRYNQAASEFENFKVLVQRITKNKSFLGARLPNYVKQRRVLSNLLQVPVMKEDSLKDSVEKKETDTLITCEVLENIMKEAIKVFWEFKEAEKHEKPLLSKVLSKNNVKVQDSSDYEFMKEIQANLHKKKKKLKDLMRTGNCMIKKFKKPQTDKLNQDLFFSKIDLKFVSKVLKMSRITGDQLKWCHEKLSKITFLDRRVQREPSFLLFPC